MDSLQSTFSLSYLAARTDMIITLLLMRKLGLREVKKLTQGHRANDG